jgi:NAD(P)H dehydrogenase (quinone)
MSTQAAYVEAQRQQQAIEVATLDDLRWADGVIWGVPTRYGNMPALYLGMVFVGTPYGQNPQIMTADGIGGSPYGPGTIAGPDGKRRPVDEELETARRLGARVAEVGALLRPMRERREHGQQETEPRRSGRAA